MRIRRFTVRVADTVQEYVDKYCLFFPKYRDVWRSIKWHLELRADKLVKEQVGDILIAWFNLDRSMPLTTIYYTIESANPRPIVKVIHVRFDPLH